MNVINLFKRLRLINARKPGFIIYRSGQLTPRPQVHLSVSGTTGSMTIFSHDDTDQGRATIEMHAKTLSHITGLPVTDERELHQIPSSNHDPVGFIDIPKEPR